MAKTIEEVAREVIKGNYGNGEERKKKLAAEGYDYNQVQSKVNELMKAPSQGAKSIEDIAKEVIKGNWGNGQERVDKLKAAGYDAAAVQKRVNELLKK